MPLEPLAQFFLQSNWVRATRLLFLQMGDSKMAADSQVDDPLPDRSPSSIDSDVDEEQDAAEEEPSEQPVQPQKRKGGRKPVRYFECGIKYCLLICIRYMRLPKNESNETGKPRPPFVNGEQNISSNWRQPSSSMRTHSAHCNKTIVLLQMNALCFDTRIRYWSGSCSKRVCRYWIVLS